MDYLSRASKPVRPAEGGIKSTDQSFLGKGGGKENRNKCPLGEKGKKSVAILPCMKGTRCPTNLALILLWEKRKRNPVTTFLGKGEKGLLRNELL